MILHLVCGGYHCESTHSTGLRWEPGLFWLRAGELIPDSKAMRGREERRREEGEGKRARRSKRVKGKTE